MPIPTEYFAWFLDGSKRPTRFKMTREEAQERHPGAEPDLSSREVRQLPTTEELAKLMAHGSVPNVVKKDGGT